MYNKPRFAHEISTRTHLLISKKYNKKTVYNIEMRDLFSSERTHKETDKNIKIPDIYKTKQMGFS